MKSWIPVAEELAVMQAQQDKAAGLIQAFVVPGGMTYNRFVGNAGERCAEFLLKENFPDCSITNANSSRVNQSGHDLTVTGVRCVLVSVKALTQVEGCGWLRGSSAKSLKSDLTLHIDFGVMVTTRGRYAKYRIPVKAEPDIYVVPAGEVSRWTSNAKYGMGKSRWIYCWKRKPSPADSAAEVRDLLLWKDRFDLIGDVVGR